eukprot:scaffold236_cov419-Prasinococcus_capsulatus_cf.AAC.45
MRDLRGSLAPRPQGPGRYGRDAQPPDSYLGLDRRLSVFQFLVHGARQPYCRRASSGVGLERTVPFPWRARWELRCSPRLPRAPNRVPSPAPSTGGYAESSVGVDVRASFEMSECVLGTCLPKLARALAAYPGHKTPSLWRERRGRSSWLGCVSCVGQPCLHGSRLERESDGRGLL